MATIIAYRDGVEVRRWSGLRARLAKSGAITKSDDTKLARIMTWFKYRQVRHAYSEWQLVVDGGVNYRPRIIKRARTTARPDLAVARYNTEDCGASGRMCGLST